MTSSAKWTAVSFFALTALAVGAFAGCTVTSGNPNDIDGGSGTSTTPPDKDSSTGTDSGTADAGLVCEGNKQTSGDFKSAACQQALNAGCCAELKGCFNLVVDQDAGGGPTDDCNKYATCVDFAQSQPTQAEKEAAQKECDLSAPQNVQDAYGAIETCAKTQTACQ